MGRGNSSQLRRSPAASRRPHAGGRLHHVGANARTQRLAACLDTAGVPAHAMSYRLDADGLTACAPERADSNGLALAVLHALSPDASYLSERSDPDYHRWFEDLRMALSYAGDAEDGAKHFSYDWDLLSHDEHGMLFIETSDTIADLARSYYRLPSQGGHRAALVPDGLLSSITASRVPSAASFTERIRREPSATIAAAYAAAMEQRREELADEVLLAQVPASLVGPLRAAPLERLVAVSAAFELSDDQTRDATVVAALAAAPYGSDAPPDPAVLDAVDSATRAAAVELLAGVSIERDVASGVPFLHAEKASGPLADALRAWTAEPTAVAIADTHRRVSDTQDNSDWLEASHILFRAMPTAFQTAAGKKRYAAAVRSQNARYCNILNYVSGPLADGSNRRARKTPAVKLSSR